MLAPITPTPRSAVILAARRSVQTWRKRFTAHSATAQNQPDDGPAGEQEHRQRQRRDEGVDVVGEQEPEGCAASVQMMSR